MWNGCVDLPGQLNKSGREIVLLGLPRKVKRIDRYAMAAQAGAGIKRRIAEGLRARRFDDLPDIDVHAISEQLELVHERDVHRSVDVFQKLDEHEALRLYAFLSRPRP